MVFYTAFMCPSCRKKNLFAQFLLRAPFTPKTVLRTGFTMMNEACDAPGFTELKF